MNNHIVYNASAKWRDVDLGELLGTTWPLTVSETLINDIARHDEELLSEHSSVSPHAIRYIRGRINRSVYLSVSPHAIRYFWAYEHEIRLNEQYSMYPSLYQGTLPRLRNLLVLPDEGQLTAHIEWESYSNYIQNQILLVNELHQLYTLCDNPIEGDRICRLFQILDTARNWYHTAQNNEISSSSFLPINDSDFRRKLRLRHWPRSLWHFYSALASGFKIFPLLYSFIDWCTEREAFYRERYNREIQFRKPKRIVTIPYWERQDVQPRLIKEFKEFCANRHDKHTHYIDELMIPSYQKQCLEALERYINIALDSSKPSISNSAHCLYWTTKDLPQALLIHLVTDVVSDKRYVVCHICHRLFPIEQNKGQKYCPDHTQSNIRSFQDQLANKKKRSIQNEKLISLDSQE